MKINLFLILLFFNFSLFSCKKSEPKKNSPPHINNEIKHGVIDNKKPSVPKPASKLVKIKPVKLTANSPLTCISICNHLGYCQTQKKGNFTVRERNECIKKCSAKKKSETLSIVTNIQKSCVDKFRGDQCDKLHLCLKNKILEARKKLRGKQNMIKTNAK